MTKFVYPTPEDEAYYHTDIEYIRDILENQYDNLESLTTVITRARTYITESKGLIATVTIICLVADKPQLVEITPTSVRPIWDFSPKMKVHKTFIGLRDIED